MSSLYHMLLAEAGTRTTSPGCDEYSLKITVMDAAVYTTTRGGGGPPKTPGPPDRAKPKENMVDKPCKCSTSDQGCRAGKNCKMSHSWENVGQQWNLPWSSHATAKAHGPVSFLMSGLLNPARPCTSRDCGKARSPRRHPPCNARPRRRPVRNVRRIISSVVILGRH